MYVTPKQASNHYNVSEQALRSWANSGKIKYITTKGGHRRYSLSQQLEHENRQKIIYARVSSRKQQGDLDRQIQFMQSKYPTHRIISDIGSGINFKRKGFKTILDGIFKGTIEEVVVAKRDRFTRFGYDLFEWIFKEHQSRLISDSIEGEEDASNELSEDLMAIITVFSSRYYGKRKYKILQESKDISK